MKNIRGFTPHLCGTNLDNMFYVYIIKGAHDKLYIGITQDFDKRLNEHNSGLSLATKPYRPWLPVYLEGYANLMDAKDREKKLKQFGKVYAQLKRRIWRSLRSRKSAGFTLVEVVIYIALLSFLISFTILTLYQVLGGESQNATKIELTNESNFVMQKLAWAFSGAQAINQVTISSTSATLSLNKYGFSSNPLVFQASSAGFSLARGSSSPVMLTSSRVGVGQFTFTPNYGSSTSPQSVQISVSLKPLAVSSFPQSLTSAENTFYLSQ